MADSTIKPDTGNDLVLQNNGGTGKIEINDGAEIDVTIGSSVGDDFNVGSGKLVVKGDTGIVQKNDSYFELRDGSTTYGYIGKGSDLVTLKNAQDLSLRYGLTSGTNTREFHIAEQANPRLTLGVGGDCTLHNGSLIIGNAGKGIDFSNASGSGSGSTSALLDDYEEGTVDQPLNVGSSGGSVHTNGFYRNTSKYTKIGNRVCYNCNFDTFGTSLPTTGSIWLNVPFAVNTNEYNLMKTVFYLTASGGAQPWQNCTVQLYEGATTRALIYSDDYLSSPSVASTSDRIIVNICFVYTTT